MALCKVESLGIFCRVSAYFSVSQPRVPDREILTKSEHSVRGPREAVFTVTTGRGLPPHLRMLRSAP